MGKWTADRAGWYRVGFDSMEFLGEERPADVPIEELAEVRVTAFPEHDLVATETVRYQNSSGGSVTVLPAGSWMTVPVEWW